jgi:hypothetical protein
MSIRIGSIVHSVSLLAVLAFLISAAPAHAQRRFSQQQAGGCGSQAQMSALQSALRSQQYSYPQYSYPQYGSQQTASAAQLAMLQQASLQAQLYGLQQSVFLAQLDGTSPDTALQNQLAALQQYTTLLQQSGQLTSSQVRNLRQQQRALAKQLRALQGNAS